MYSIIVCMNRDRAIGYKNRLLYHIKDDMARFRELTTGHTIIMGRNTYDSLPNGALPHRRNIVISRTLSSLPDCEVYSSIEEALVGCASSTVTTSDKVESEEEEVFIIGGDSIYRQMLPLATRLYLTIVDASTPQADTVFPEIDMKEWQVVEKEMRNANGIPFTFLTLLRQA